MKKSRFCVSAYNDKDHKLFIASPTKMLKSLRLLIALCEMFDMRMYTRDIFKAFVQSKTSLKQPGYVQPPSKMCLEKSDILSVIKPLYGMPECPIHWFKAFLLYHLEYEYASSSYGPVSVVQYRFKCNAEITRYSSR